MSLIALGSAHGSPGVTTTALALAATWPEERPCLLVEADLFGGMIRDRYGLSDTPGLSSLAAIARRGLNEEVVLSNAQQLPGGVDVPTQQMCAPNCPFARLSDASFAPTTQTKTTTSESS